MSVLIGFSPTHLTTEQYDESIRRLKEMGEWLPDGLEKHVCFGDGDNLNVSEIWDSPEQLQAFGEKLMPVLADIGIEAGEPEIVNVYNLDGR
jgi:hypothetical protein